MSLSIQIASLDEKPLMYRMMELYQYDFSEFGGADLDEEGCFGYPYFETYWTHQGDRVPFLARVQGKPAGFALVNPHTYLPENQYVMAEFFVLRKYRRQGIGRRFAAHVFDWFSGKWEVDQLLTNVPAQHFWRKVIRDYTGGHFAESKVEIDGKPRILQCFDNSDRVNQLKGPSEHRNSV